MYLTGLSGGSLPVTSLSSYNFPTVDDILPIWQPWIDRQGNSTNSTGPGSPVSIIVDLAGKLQAGFNISATDYLGRLAAYEFMPGPHGGVNSTWSGVTRLSNFINHQMPFPMLQASELTDDDKEYFGIKVPYYNATSVRNKVSITLDAAKDWDSMR
jgi:lysophospholipase